MILFHFVAGGWVGAEIGNTIERFDPDENKWEVVGSMAVSRYYFGCCEMQGIYKILFPSSYQQYSSYHFAVYVRVCVLLLRIGLY
jgi:actin-binding protein IPP